MSSLAIVSQPFAEPVPLVEMKVHIRAATDITDDDLLISSQMVAARDVIETATGYGCDRQKCMMATTFDYALDSFPSYFGRGWGDTFGSFIQLPRVPVVSVTSITYTDTNGDSQTLSTDVYSVDIPRGRCYIKWQQIWPMTRWLPNSVIVRFVAGMAATFGGENTNTDTLTVYGRALTNGDRVRLMNSGGALPVGLAALTDYFAVGVSGSTFQLSATSGGGAVDITAPGTGTQFLSIDLSGFESLRAAIKLLTAFWYESRAAVDTGRLNVGATVLPLAVDSLVNSQHA